MNLKPTNTETQEIERQIVMTEEQRAELEALHAASQLEQPPAATQQAAQGQTLGGELAGVIKMARNILGPAFPSLLGIYTDEVAETAGNAVAAVCNKHGWLQDGLVGEWGEEVACAAILLPLGFATVQGVRADLQQRRQAADDAMRIERNKGNQPSISQAEIKISTP